MYLNDRLVQVLRKTFSGFIIKTTDDAPYRLIGIGEAYYTDQNNNGVLFYYPIDEFPQWDKQLTVMSNSPIWKHLICESYSPLFSSSTLETICYTWGYWRENRGELLVDLTDGEGTFDSFVHAVKAFCEDLNGKYKTTSNIYLAMIEDIFDPTKYNEWADWVFFEEEDTLHALLDEDYGIPSMLRTLVELPAEHRLRGLSHYDSAINNIRETYNLLAEK